MRCYESVTFPASLSMTLKAKHKPCALRKNVISWQIKEFDPDHVVILLIKILQSSTSHVFIYNISEWTKLNHLWYEKTLLHIGRVTLIHHHGLSLLLRYMPILQLAMACDSGEVWKSTESTGQECLSSHVFCSERKKLGNLEEQGIVSSQKTWEISQKTELT